MKYTKLGSSGLEVSRICLGCMSFGEESPGAHDWSLDEAASRPIIEKALDLGINFFDTANAYSIGSSEETLGALHDAVTSGKVRYIGASSMWAWQFSKALYTSERRGFTKFVSMQNQYSLLQREEEREMHPLCADQGVGTIPWSPLGRGLLTRDWDETTRRSQSDPMMATRFDEAKDRPIVDRLARWRGTRACPGLRSRWLGCWPIPSSLRRSSGSRR